MNTDHAAQPEEVMAYVDGELPREAAERVRIHLDECGECRKLASELGDVSRRLHAWEVGPVPASLRPRPRGWRIPSRQLMGVAATLAVVIAGAAWLAMWREPGPSVAQEAVSVSHADDRAGRGSGVVGGVVGGLPGAPPPPRAPSSAASVVAVPPAQSVVEGPLVIRTAQLTIQPTDFDAASQALDRIIANAGGFVGRMVTHGRRGTARVVEATLRIPSSKLDTVLASLRALGHVSGETREGEDVTRQSADLDARLANARASEARLRQLLERRTGNLADVLAVERELARVRGDVEYMEAERKSLDQRISYATVNVTLTEERKAEVSLGPTSFSTRVRNAFIEGWTLALGMVLGALLVTVRLAPVLLVLAALLVPAVFVVRRWRSGFFTKSSPTSHDA